MLILYNVGMIYLRKKEERKKLSVSDDDGDDKARRHGSMHAEGERERLR